MSEIGMKSVSQICEKSGGHDFKFSRVPRPVKSASLLLLEVICCTQERRTQSHTVLVLRIHVALADNCFYEIYCLKAATH